MESNKPQGVMYFLAGSRKGHWMKAGLRVRRIHRLPKKRTTATTRGQLKVTAKKEKA